MTRRRPVLTDRVLDAILIVGSIVAALIIGWAVSALAAEIPSCPVGVAVPYGSPTSASEYHNVYQPNSPAMYVEAIGPDGSRYPTPMGTYGPAGFGQWFVCYLEDATVWKSTITTTSTATPLDTSTPTSTTTLAARSVTTTTAPAFTIMAPRGHTLRPLSQRVLPLWIRYV